MSIVHQMSGILLESSQAQTATEFKGARYVLHSNHKIMSRAITALSKLGIDMFIEPMDDGLSLKAYNRTKSAYGIFLFSADFFSEFQINDLPLNPKERLCRIPMKSALAFFKGLQFGDKSFISSEIIVDPKGDFITIKLLHASSVLRSFEVGLLETQTSFRSAIDKTSLRNSTIANANVFTMFLSSMAHEEELVIQTAPGEFIFKNYLSSANNPRKVTETQANLPGDRLIRHNVQISGEISFCMKEFMAILQFANSLSAIVSLYYDRPGKPLVISLEDDINFSAEFIISTTDMDHLDVTSEDSRLTSSNQSRRSTTDMPASDENARPEEHEPVAKMVRSHSEGDQIEDARHRTAVTFSQPNPVGTSTVLGLGTTGLDQLSIDNQAGGDVPEDVPVYDEMHEEMELPATPPPPEVPEASRIEEEDSRMQESATQPTQKKKNQFRNYFLSGRTATQRASQTLGNGTVLANDSDAEE